VCVGGGGSDHTFLISYYVTAGSVSQGNDYNRGSQPVGRMSFADVFCAAY
jgi:hypothetical protein